jgi:hypothetical protein
VDASVKHLVVEKSQKERFALQKELGEMCGKRSDWLLLRYNTLFIAGPEHYMLCFGLHKLVNYTSLLGCAAG